ncbi:hypothetical protein [Mycolicibacterium fluoranthenivorans]|uniref:Uncharacterized protein n=1 Tax=Mycolicibacterium fluoranthenivorans TaxID=258505 RepID=A0A1G4WZH9_9MYCO|nr:hypothetical protein [Mycolicibacterium fluoranthenivorans]SCX32937.1 hypothetical protein SAMN02799620_05752 [Mycolicibacterium fluoranthenivorans]
MADESRREAEQLFAKFSESDGLVILPQRRLDDGRGVYEKGLIDLVKDLRDEGITVSWADVPAQRAYLEKRSAAEVVWGALLGVPSGVVSSVIYAALGRWFSRDTHRAGSVRLGIVRETTFPDGTTTREWLDFDGNGDEVAALVKASAPHSLPPEKEDD